MQVAKQPIVIEYPVKRRGAEDAVEPLLEGHFQQVAADEFDTIAEIWLEIGTSDVNHVLREVECHNVSAGQSLQEFSRKSAGAAAGIEDGFIAAQRNPRQNLFAPAHLRAGYLVIKRGIPFAGIRILGHGELLCR